jgi:hypothetical protein
MEDMTAKATKRPKRYQTKATKVALVSRAMSELAKVGAKARAEKLSPERRREIAINASKAAAAARTKKAAERKRQAE